MTPESDHETCVRKGKFYYEMVTIQVEKSLHCVPRHHLTEWSQVFRDMFDLPLTPDAEGVSDERPIVLPGCTNFEFESLLEILLTPGYDPSKELRSNTDPRSRRHLSPLHLEKEQWIAGLKLSTMWDMQKASIRIRSLCIRELSSSALTPLDKVDLGRSYKVAAWVIEGCTALVEDADNLNLDSLSALGWETAARICWISREYTIATLSSQREAKGIGSIPPTIWICGKCNATGNFQSGYCFGCRSHTPSISVDMASVVIANAANAGSDSLVSGEGEGGTHRICELILATFDDELSQMDG
ncbi:hypothetical protein NMY22_g5869 [Coprinellus aureogranulatus]|nr:hypothetical protein NMY22_g5869 [Coprinellus aureogranulatus]